MKKLFATHKFTKTQKIIGFTLAGALDVMSAMLIVLVLVGLFVY